MLTAMGVAWVCLSFAATFIVDANISFRIPFVARLADDYAKRSDAPVLVLGSSRVRDGIEINRLSAYMRRSFPSGPSSAFVAGVTFGGHVAQQTALNEFLGAGPKPAVVVLEMNPELLDARKRWINVQRDLTWATLFDLSANEMRTFASPLAMNRFFPLFVRRFEIRLAAWTWAFERMGIATPSLDPLEPQVPVLASDYVLSSPPRPSTSSSVRDLQVRFSPRPMKEFSPTGSAARALDRMLATCQARQIPVLLLNVPICSESRAALAGVARPFERHVMSLLARFPQARYFDASALLPDEAFLDHHHPNLYGQDLLCRRLGEEILPEAFATRGRESGGETALRIGAAHPNAMAKTK